MTALAWGLAPVLERWTMEKRVRKWEDKISWLLLQEEVRPAPGTEPAHATPLPARLEGAHLLRPEKSPYYVSRQTRVERGASLVVPAGVEILFGRAAGLVVLGELQVKGTRTQPVRFGPAQPGTEWAGLFAGGAESRAVFHESKFRESYYGIKAVRSAVEMDQCQFANVREPYSGDRAHARFSGCDVTFTNFQARGNVNLFKFWKGTAVVEDCVVQCPPTDYKVDAFDVDHVRQATFRRSRIHGVACEGADGIDVGVGSRHVLIVDCHITDFVDKAISVGEQARARIERSTLVRCAMGIGVKDRGRADIDKTTFYQVGVGVAAYEKIPGAGGGWARVRNSAFSQIGEDDVRVDEVSFLETTDCVSEKRLLPGEGNRVGSIPSVDPSGRSMKEALFLPEDAVTRGRPPRGGRGSLPASRPL